MTNFTKYRTKVILILLLIILGVLLAMSMLIVYLHNRDRALSQLRIRCEFCGREAVYAGALSGSEDLHNDKARRH